jgi:uncharacterized protein
MSQAAKAQEPSMEEILASIRRIIADDETKPAKPEPAAAPAPPPVAERAPPPRPVEPPRPAPPPVAAEPVADVLDLTEAMLAAPPVPPQPASSFRTIDGESDVVFSDRPPEPEPIRAVEEARRQFTQTTDRSLMSNSTMAAVDTAFSSLAHTVLGNNARTLEDLVKEMLRPMLKSWLDDNLPGLVERLVRAEIERVSRGRG